MNDKRELRVNSFFAGIGGFDLGFERQGYMNTFICENNGFCNEVLSARWPNVTKAGDINEVKPEIIPDAEIWCGGFPCQDISVARGSMSRLGLKGSRSGLFHRFAELIGEKKPEAVLIENVAGLFNSNKGNDFAVILATMNELGYGVAWRLLNSRYFGVTQSRPRVYLCCWKGKPTKAFSSIFENSVPSKPSGVRSSFITESTPKGLYPRVPVTGYCLAATSGRHTGTDWSRTYVTCADGVRRLTPIECERLQGFPDNWTNVEGDTEDSDSLRYAAIGNAVSVPVIEWIAGRMKSAYADPSPESIDNLVSNHQCFNNASWRDVPDIDFEHEKLVWPKSGLMWDGKYISVDHREAPCSPATSTLYQIVEKDDVNPRYYLTPNAAEGILRRVDNNNRQLFGPLRDGLEKLSGRRAK